MPSSIGGRTSLRGALPDSACSGASPVETGGGKGCFQLRQQRVELGPACRLGAGNQRRRDAAHSRASEQRAKAVQGRRRARAAAEPDGPACKIGGESDIKAAAGYVAKSLRESASVDVLAVGPFSVNQAVKALALARQFLEEDSLDLSLSLDFHAIDDDPRGNDVTLRASRCAREGLGFFGSIAARNRSIGPREIVT